MSRLEIASGLVLAVAGLALAVWVIPAQSVPGDEGEIAPAFMPTAAALTFVALGVLQAIAGWRHAPGADAGWGRYLLAAGVGLALATALIAWTGFVIGGAVSVLTLGLLMGARGSARWWLIGVALALPLLTHTLAWHGLRLALP